MIKKTDVQNLARSFRYAFHGISYCVINERNMRIHLSAVALVSYFGFYYGLNKTEFLFLLLCCGFVISAEAVNTAIEALVNLESPSYHHYARIAKDVAAGAVAVAAITAAVVGIVLFFDPPRLLDTLAFIFTNPVRGVTAGVLVVLAVLFIFNGPKLFSGKVPGADDLKKLRR